MTDAEERAKGAGFTVVNWDVELDPQFSSRLPSESVNMAARAYADGRIGFYSNAARGFFVFTSHAAGTEILQDHETFSSLQGTHLFTREQIPHRPLPMQLDPPEHTKIRALLYPFFSPKLVKGRFEEEARRICVNIIGPIAQAGECDILADFAEQITAPITLAYMGVSPELGSSLVAAVRQRSKPQSAGAAQTAYKQGVSTIREVFEGVIADRRERPADDIPTALIRARINETPLDDDILLNLCCTVFAAGVHTTSAELGFIFYHLARDPALRRRIVDEPAVIPKAIEEFLRYEPSAILNGRVVSKDIDFHGVPLRAGDRVLVASVAANRDARVFQHPDSIDFDQPNRQHLSFGTGVHHCIGHHLARTIMRVALEEWHRAIPEYALGDMSHVTYELSANGRISPVPVVFDRHLETI